MKRLSKVLVCLAATLAMVLLSRVLFSSGLLDFTKLPEFEEGSYTDYYYLELDSTQKKTYTAIRESIYTFPVQIEIPAPDSGSLSHVLDALLCDDPYLFMFDSGSLMTVGKHNYFVPDYLMGIEKYEQTKEQVEKAADDMLVGLPDGSDYDKELFIHDAIINSCVYSDEDIISESTVEGVFVEGRAKCSGYSRAFKLLLEKAGIESVLIHGTPTDYDGNSVKHMWNAVNLDGGWYFTDVTWDDPVSDDGENYCRHTFFNMNAAMLNRTHSEYSFTYPCTDISQYYYAHNNAYYNVYNKDTILSIAQLIAESENGEAEFMFADASLFETAVQKLFKGEEIYRSLETANLKKDGRLVTTSVRYSLDYNANLITIFFEYKD